MAGEAFWHTIPSAGGGGDVEAIAESILSSASATIDFASIPSTYKHLRLVILARKNASGTTNVALRFNNDSGSNYDYHRMLLNNAALTATASVGQTVGEIGFATTSTASAGLFGQCVVDIARYAGTVHQKLAQSTFSQADGITAAGLRAGIYHASWRSTAAINRITLLLGSGSFDTGSMATLYGYNGP